MCAFVTTNLSRLNARVLTWPTRIMLTLPSGAPGADKLSELMSGVQRLTSKASALASTQHPLTLPSGAPGADKLSELMSGVQRWTAGNTVAQSMASTLGLSLPPGTPGSVRPRGEEAEGCVGGGPAAGAELGACWWCRDGWRGMDGKGTSGPAAADVEMGSIMGRWSGMMGGVEGCMCAGPPLALRWEAWER